MRSLRLLLVPLVVLGAILLGLPVVDARVQTLDAAADDIPFETADRELLDALAAAGLIDRWYESSPVGVEASGLRIRGDAAYVDLRVATITRARDLATSRADEVALLSAIAELESSITLLEDLAHELRARFVRDASPLDQHEVASIRKALLQARAAHTHDSLHGAIGDLDRLRLDLTDEVVVAQRRSRTDKLNDGRALSAVLNGLDALRADLDALRSEAEVTTAAEAALVSVIEQALPELHRMRQLAQTDIDGLSLVTVDAYVRAGAHGIAGCGVSWPLLAGIGRVESIHGTLGEASVGPTGLASPAILGPLLDGGATEREAEEARRAAEEAAAEAERLALEEAERLAEEEAARRSRLYGDLTAPTPEELAKEREERAAAEEAAARDENGDDDADPDGDAPAEDEDDDEPAGNGFAVIADSDGGALDGNASWDRAVGPMQFLPETWDRFAVDGDGDGVLDPHNLYDATRSAANYLCHLERRNGGASPWVYVLGYNNSDRYVAAVMGHAERIAGYALPVAVG